MRQIPPPEIDDIAALGKLSKSRAAHAVAIRAQHAQIEHQFESYANANGDPWTVAADPLLAPFRENFEGLYSDVPIAINHVKALRRGLTGACPMCGRDALGTLDHYLPQSNYPEFCFFSKNLIPACNRCNTARGNDVKGPAAGQRALHPYFDAFAAHRVMTVIVLPDYRAPDIKPVPFKVAGGHRDIVQWQIDHVIIPSGFVEYADPIWGTLLANPEMLGHEATTQAVEARLLQLENDDALLRKSRNSWTSCIFHGLRNDPNVVEFLRGRLEQLP